MSFLLTTNIFRRFTALAGPEVSRTGMRLEFEILILQLSLSGQNQILGNCFIYISPSDSTYIFDKSIRFCNHSLDSHQHFSFFLSICVFLLINYGNCNL